MIGNGADAEASFAVAGSVHIEGGGLHLQGHYAHLLEAVHAVETRGYVHVVAVEHVGRVHIAHVVGGVVALAGLYGFGKQFVGCDGGKGAGQVKLLGIVRVGAGTLGQDDVIEVDVILDGAGGADADDVLHTEEIEQLVGVDADGGHTHTGCHHGHLDALIVAGVAVDTTDVVHQHGVFQEVFGDELAAQGIAGHQHGFAEADIVLHIDVGGYCEVGHRMCLLC